MYNHLQAHVGRCIVSEQVGVSYVLLHDLSTFVSRLLHDGPLHLSLLVLPILHCSGWVVVPLIISGIESAVGGLAHAMTYSVSGACVLMTLFTVMWRESKGANWTSPILLGKFFAYLKAND
jgi:hypothetical protein